MQVYHEGKAVANTKRYGRLICTSLPLRYNNPLGEETMDLVERVSETIAREGLLLPDELVVLGVSGGPDSLCMAHILRALAGTYQVALHVAHLHHGIRGQEADEDARYVAELCASWGLPCTVERVDVPALARERGQAIEETARQARYAFLATLARRLGGKTVAVAHHADDQVETVLMHLLRGSGLAGLRGMRPLVWLDELRLGDPSAEIPRSAAERMRLIRPLLRASRSEIEEYCRAHALQPRYDLSNLDRTYYRNRLRHELIPFLETYNPAIRQVVQRTAEVIAADYEALRGQMEAAWAQVVRRESEGAIVYDLPALRGLPLSTQRSLLREGIHRLRRSLRNINWVHIDKALDVLLKGHAGVAATLPQGLMLTVGYTVAVLAPEGYTLCAEDWPRLDGPPLPVPVPGSVVLPQPGGEIVAHPWVLSTQNVERRALPGDWDHNPDPYTAYLDAGRITEPLFLRRRQQGDWFSPLGLQHRRQKLRDFMINAKIPQHERATVPLLVCGGDIAWVVGWRVDARYAVGGETGRVLLVRVARSLPPTARTLTES